MGALMDPMSWSDEVLGELPACIEVKLVDFPDAGYYAKNDPPQGEIWIRGGSVTDGYLELEQETKESFTDDGWFKTGDIGEWSPKGELKIIDRKKNLVKTLNGEYIALEKVCSDFIAGQLVPTKLIVKLSLNRYIALSPLSPTSASMPLQTRTSPLR